MRVFEYRNKDWGKVFDKISYALHKHAPEWVEWVDKVEDSELQFINVVGRGELEWLQKAKNKVIFQWCYFTAEPEKANYPKYWKDSLLTVSFHNLPDYTEEEFNFYRTPLGADPSIYKYLRLTKTLPVFTTGHVDRSESLDDVYKAASELQVQMFHTGEDFKWDKRYYKHLEYMSEKGLVKVLNMAKYVACLRKVEGFELMGVEAMMCGTRPIVYDLPTYDFYKGYADFIDPKKNVTAQLIKILSKEPKVYTKQEYKEIRDKFSWEPIIQGIYKEIERHI